MLLSEQFYQTEKTGYLNEQFRLFHLKDQTRKEFSYHYHDFHKVVIFISGKAAYHIEGKAYQLKPWDILLVNRHAIHRPEIDPSVPYERFILWIQNDIPWQELLKCFQKANDRSYNLVRLNSALQEKMKDILFELENSAKSDEYGREILTQSLFLQFMVYLNRIFLEKQYIFDKKSYTFDSQIANILQYINHNLKEKSHEAALEISVRSRPDGFKVYFRKTDGNIDDKRYNQHDNHYHVELAHEFSAEESRCKEQGDYRNGDKIAVRFNLRKNRCRIVDDREAVCTDVPPDADRGDGSSSLSVCGCVRRRCFILPESPCRFGDWHRCQSEY